MARMFFIGARLKRGLIVAALALTPAFAAAAEPPAASREAIERVERAVVFIKGNRGARPSRKPEKEFFLTEGEVNAYVQNWIQEEAGRGRHKEVAIKSAVVGLKPDRAIEIDAVAQFGAGSLGAMKSAGESFWAEKLRRSLAMDNSLRLRFSVIAAKGKGFLVIHEVRVKGVPVPLSFVREILKAVGRKQRPPVDFTRPLDLPNGIRKIEVLPGAIRLRVAPLSA